MFDPGTTYPTDGLLIARPIHEPTQVGLIDGAVHAVATAHANGDDSIPLGRVYRTMTNGADHFRMADGGHYSYRYFRGMALNTPTPERMPVMVFGPDDTDLPWLVGKVVHRDGMQRVTVAPLWGPVGQALPPVAHGDAWARVAAIPPATLLWHPDDDLDAAQAKQEARNAWLRWHVAWIALLGETVSRDWGSNLRGIAEEVSYTPPKITWDVSANVSLALSLPHRVTDEEMTYLRSRLGTPEGGYVNTSGVYVRVSERVSTSMASALPPDLEDEDTGVESRLRNELARQRPEALYLEHGGITASPSYL